MPDLRSPAGEPTGAIHGMIAMLRRLRNDYDAAYIACVFDAKGKTFRDDIYPDYKGHRPSMPEDLAKQIEPIHEAVRMLGWPILMVDGVEADDVIGTLAVEAVKHGLNTIVSTGDKDLAQLVNEHVTLVNTMSNEKLDIPGVINKFGVPPERIVDYLALIGDSVDNIPGVDKVGPKTAVKWLAQWGTLDNIIAHADEIGGAVGANLKKALDWLPTGRELLTVKTDCDMCKHMVSIPESLVGKPVDKEALLSFFQRFGFKTWMRELQSDVSAKEGSSGQGPGGPAEWFGESQTDMFDAPPPVPTDYETVLTEEQFSRWLEKINAAALTAVDTETTSLDVMEAQLVGISLCCEPGTAAYIPVAHRYQDAPAQLSRDWVLQQLK
ncbi:MAG: polA, partial [Paucimonas sp.]|nr:polA [Paucimonas sp.]